MNLFCFCLIVFAHTTSNNIICIHVHCIFIIYTSSFSSFGSKVVGTRTGIMFNNEMDDFSTPNTTNYFQVPASPANFIKPYKRPLSSISPVIVLDENGDVILVTGSSGGTRITTSNALVRPCPLRTILIFLVLSHKTARKSVLN